MHKRNLIFCGLFLALSLLAGCGGGDKDELPPAETGGGGGPSFDMSKVTATVTGKISFEGMPPANEKVQMSADPYCAQKAADYPTLETVKVSDGGLENVIVFVSTGAPTASYAAPAPAEIDQHNCHYVPHVFTVMTNQDVKIKNSDMTLHNIHTSGEKNPTFNVGQAVAGMVADTKFAVPEVPLPVKCDVHKWMGAFVGVFEHPFHTVSKQGGAFELKLPAGTYEITAWHEKYGKKTMMVTVADNDKKEANFSFSAADKAAD
jgi:hypothetical protein